MLGDEEWDDSDVEGEASNTTVEAVRCNRRELELARKQAELAERELALARREIESLRGTQQRDRPVDGRSAGVSMGTGSSRSRMDVLAIADLLCPFHGDGDSYEGWEAQVRLLRTTYELDENEVRILMGMRLKGKASE